MMTKEEYLAELETRSLNGMFPAINELGECRYRTPDGQKCAIGILISDDKYSSDMEGGNISCLIREYSLQLPEWLTQKQATELQNVHDDMSDEEWNHELFMKQVHQIIA